MKQNLSLPEVHPVTGEPMEPLPVIKRDGTGAYVTRASSDAPKKPDTFQLTEPPTYQPITPPTPKTIPIKLIYKYEGQCPECRNEVTTLNTEISGKKVMVAYCTRCNQQLASRTVRRLEEKREKSVNKSKKSKWNITSNWTNQYPNQ